MILKCYNYELTWYFNYGGTVITPCVRSRGRVIGVCVDTKMSCLSELDTFIDCSANETVVGK